MTHYRPFEDVEESDELCAEKIRDVIRDEVLIVTPSKRVYKQRKKLKDGIKEYQTTDFYIRIPSSSKIRGEKPVAVITWEGIERLMIAKEAYNISDRMLSAIFAEMMTLY